MSPRLEPGSSAILCRGLLFSTPPQTLYNPMEMTAAFITFSICGPTSLTFPHVLLSPATSLQHAFKSPWPFDTFTSHSHPRLPLPPPPWLLTLYLLLTWTLCIYTHHYATPSICMLANLGTGSSPSFVPHPHPVKVSDNTAPLGPRALSLITPVLLVTGFAQYISHFGSLTRGGYVIYRMNVGACFFFSVNY